MTEMVVEIPLNSSIKYELNEKNQLVCDRILHTPVSYPGNYGYIPNTLANDGDPLDVLLICNNVLLPCSRIKIKIIGYLDTEDEKGRDEKIIAVPSEKIDPTYSNINNITDLSEHSLLKIKYFFKHYKDLEKGKWIKVGEFMNKEKAKKLLEKYIKFSGIYNVN